LTLPLPRQIFGSPWALWVALAVVGCGGNSGGSSVQSTFAATFANPTGTNATTTPLDLVFKSSGPSGTVAPGEYFVVNGEGAVSIIWSDGGSPERIVIVDTTGTPAAGAVYTTDATQREWPNVLKYQEGTKLWGGTGTITVNSVKGSLVDFTATMAMQPDVSFPAGATGTFSLEITSSSDILYL